MSKASKNLWDRWPKESAPAFEAFATYRDFGLDRSCAKVGQKLRKSKTLMDRWSGTWQWSARARAFDNHIEKGRQLTYEIEVEEMNRRDIGMARAFKGLVAARISEMNEIVKRVRNIRAKDSGSLSDMGDILPAHAMIRWFKDSTAIERLAMGEVTERVEAAVDVEVTERLTVDQIITVLNLNEMPIDKLRLLADFNR